MAEPQIENGHLKIANELWDALARIRISGEEWQVLNVVIRKTYGWNKKEDTISLSQFVLSTGLKRPNVVRARNKLEAKNIINIKKKTNSLSVYRINKDFDQWEPLSKKVTTRKDHLPEEPPDQNESPSNCPHSKIVGLWHSIMPELPIVKKITPELQKTLRARWKEDTDRQDLKWWEDYFYFIRESDFLMGKVKDFQVDFYWVIGPKNITKILNGRFNRSQGKNQGIAEWLERKMVE